MQSKVRLLVALSVLGCGSPTLEREPRPDAPLEVRDRAPDDEVGPTIELRVRDGRVVARYEGGLLNVGLHVAVGAWTHLHFTTPVGPDGSATVRTIDVPELGWTLSVRSGPGAHRWVRASRPFEAGAYCVAGCSTERRRSSVTAVSRRRFWNLPPPPEPPPWGYESFAQWGAELIEHNGCTSCHGSEVGELSDVWGSTRISAEGREIEVRGDAGRAYVEAWTHEPGRFPASQTRIAMPSFSLAQGQMFAIVEYMRCGDVAVCPPEVEPSTPASLEAPEP